LPDAGHNEETVSDRSSAGATGFAARTAPSLAILGSDALLAARPASAVQLAHACLRIGFQAVVPASWGDELIASGCLRQLGTRRSAGESGPTIFCACPFVAHRLLAAGPDLEPFLASFVAPPVAVARYLRTIYETTRLRLTYVGRCPGAADDAIDARLTPDELLAVLAERGVDLEQQPRAFDSVIPPDRRRFLSQPGGLPAAEVLRRADPERRVVEVTAPELAPELAQHLLSKADVLIDVAARLGCACSGAVAGSPVDGARDGVLALEPPRASSPVVDDRVPIAIELPLPSAARNALDLIPAVAGRRTSGGSRAVQSPPDPAPAPTTQRSPGPPSTPGDKRRSPAHGVTVRQPSGAVPTTRSGEGRALPRAYVARRGTGTRGRGPSTPPRGEPPQKLDASARGEGRGETRGVPRGGGRSVAPPSERVERVEREEMPALAPASTLTAPSGEVPVLSREPVVARPETNGAPNHAADPHAESAGVAGQMAVAEPQPRESVHTTVPEADDAIAPSAEPRGPSPISGPSAASAASLRVRTTELARMAVGAGHQRRATVAALLAVALLSASVGVLAGRWLAARTGAAAGAAGSNPAATH
jgi:hypothetical protein